MGTSDGHIDAARLCVGCCCLNGSSCGRCGQIWPAAVRGIRLVSEMLGVIRHHARACLEGWENEPLPDHLIEKETRHRAPREKGRLMSGQVARPEKIVSPPRVRDR